MSLSKLSSIHPGRILRSEFLEPLEISQRRLARAIRVPPRRINFIANGRCAVTADTALRLASYFGTSPQFWLNLQTRHDLEMAEERLGRTLARQVKIRSAPRAA